MWDVAEASLRTLVVALDNITCASWRPEPPTAGGALPARERNINTLAYCTGTSRVYVYEMRDGACPTSVNIPHDAYAVTSLSWSSDGSTLLLQGNENLTTLHVDHMLSRE